MMTLQDVKELSDKGMTTEDVGSKHLRNHSLCFRGPAPDHEKWPERPFLPEVFHVLLHVFP